jgi:hypothetical protein
MQQQRAGEEIFETPDVEDESKEDVVRVKEILTVRIPPVACVGCMLGCVCICAGIRVVMCCGGADEARV